MDIKATRVFAASPEGPGAPRAAAMRRNFYVKPLGPDLWEAICAIAGNRFPSRQAALDWARSSAQQEFDATGQPWGVKVWGPEGGWIYDMRLGAASDDVPGSSPDTP